MFLSMILEEEQTMLFEDVELRAISCRGSDAKIDNFW